ncbi:hypothetical protein EMCRGX_G026806 [Ephydatia muelleri]
MAGLSCNTLSAEVPIHPDTMHQKAKQWIDSFLSIPAGGYKKSHVTPYMHCMAYHVPECIRRYGNLRKLSGQGFEKHNDNAKRAYFSSNKWNASMDIIRTEARIDCLRNYATPKTQSQRKTMHTGFMEAFRQEWIMTRNGLSQGMDHDRKLCGNRLAATKGKDECRDC